MVAVGARPDRGQAHRVALRHRRGVPPSAPGVRGARSARRRPAGSGRAYTRGRRVWAAASARAGCEVWWLDRQPLGGVVEGNRPRPVRVLCRRVRSAGAYGLTGGEIALRERGARMGGGADLAGLRLGRALIWPAWGARGCAVAEHADYPTALVYPGLCLLEATGLSEGRGTTARSASAALQVSTRPRGSAHGTPPPGLAFVPALFRPQFQKHASEALGEWERDRGGRRCGR